MPDFFLSLLVMAGVTYLIRMLPIVLIKHRIKNRFVRSFLYYVPYAVLGVMTVPAVFYSTSYFASALAGTLVASVMAYFEKKLLTVAASACITVFVTELVITLI